MVFGYGHDKQVYPHMNNQEKDQEQARKSHSELFGE
jgi:hypothetical protein